MEKVWHNLSKWEDLGMWRDISKEEYSRFYDIAVKFTGDHVLYGSFMRKVLEEFPYSCEHNLTDLSINRKAWIGHAACFLATSCPEYVTRSAWSALSDQQRDLANKEALSSIRKWELMYEGENSGVDREMGGKGLF